MVKWITYQSYMLYFSFLFLLCCSVYVHVLTGKVLLVRTLLITNAILFNITDLVVYVAPCKPCIIIRCTVRNLYPVTHTLIGCVDILRLGDNLHHVNTNHVLFVQVCVYTYCCSNTYYRCHNSYYLCKGYTLYGKVSYPQVMHMHRMTTTEMHTTKSVL